MKPSNRDYINLLKNAKTITDPEVRRRYLKAINLPPMVKEALFAPVIADKIVEIGENHKLTENQIYRLSILIGGILLGEDKIAEFIVNIQKKCNLAPEISQATAQQINREIFIPLKEDLQKIHNLNEWPGVKENIQKSPENSNVINLRE